MRSLLAGSLALMLVTLAPPARAEQQWALAPGPFFFGHDYARLSGEQPSSPRLGGGVEVSLMRFPGPAFKNPYGYGLVGQVALLELDRHAAWYGALGVQAGSVLGVELGAYARSAGGTVAAEAGLRIAPYVSFGFAWASFPVEVPIGDAPGHLSAMCGFKFPFAIDGTSLLPAPPREGPPTPTQPRPVATM